MLKGRRVGRVIRITSFQTIKRGNWKLKFSTTDQDTIMVLCQSVLDTNNTFIKFFSNEDEAISFVDFLIKQDTYILDDK